AARRRGALRRGFAGRVRFSSLSMRPASGVRVVAVFEAAKGALVLFAGFGLVELIYRGAQHVAEEFVRHSHLNPASGGMYIPIEIYELWSHVSWIKVCVLLVNAGIVAYMSYALWQSKQNRSTSPDRDIDVAGR